MNTPSGTQTREQLTADNDSLRAALQVSDERLRLAIEAADIGTWHWDLATDELVWSDRCKSLFGLTPAESMSYERFLTLLLPEDRPATERAVRRALEEGRDYSIEYRVVWPDATEHWLLAQGRTLLDAGGRPIRFEGIVQSIDARKRDEAERESLTRQLQEAAERQRRFLVDVLLGVTDGRLRLCDARADLPAPITPSGEPVLLQQGNGLRILRLQVALACEAAGLTEVRCFDLITAVGEASMNAVVHAGGGSGRVFQDPESGIVQVWVEDAGKGIAMENLPHATLARGYSTAATLGHGFKMMLQTADSVWLLTGPEGTTVVLEQNRTPPHPNWL